MRAALKNVLALSSTALVAVLMAIVPPGEAAAAQADQSSPLPAMTHRAPTVGDEAGHDPSVMGAQPATTAATARPVRAQSYAQLDAASLGLAPSSARATTMLFLRGDRVCYSIRWVGVEAVTTVRVVLRGANGTPGDTVLTLFDGAARAGGKADGCVRPVARNILVALADHAPDHLVMLSTSSAPAGALAGTLKPQVSTRRPLLEGTDEVTAVASAPDGTQWFTTRPDSDRPGSILTRIDPQGVMTTRDLAMPGDPDDTYLADVITAPRGVLWVSTSYFTSRAERHRVTRITRLDAQGGSRTYRMPTGLAPYSLTIGPDGAVWFAGRQITPTGDTWGIGRLSRDGAVQFWPFDGPGTVTDVVTGSDGNVWFLCNGMKHGRITPSGQITRFGSAVDRDNHAGGSASIGPDGAIWFASWVNGIGRLSTDGKLTYTKLDAPTDEATYDLFFDPNGTLWFLGDRQFSIWPCREIGRMTPDGRLTRFYLPELPDFPRFLAPTPGGLIRVFADDGLNVFVRPPYVSIPG